MSLRRVVILHGYTAYPEKHWFMWLREQLRALDVETVIPQLPDADHPNVDAWTDAAVATLGEPASDTVLIGHSLGTVTAIRALGRAFASAPETQLGGLVLVSPFVDPVPGLSELDPFTLDVPALDPLAARIGRRIVFHSDNDAVVPPALAEPVIAGLDADVQVVPGAGHFMESEGWTTFPALASWLSRA